MKKICNKCSVEKDLCEFHFRKDSEKYRNECKSCFRIECKNNYCKNRKNILDKKKKYALENKNKISKYQKKKYRSDRREYFEKYRHEYYIKNSHKFKEYNKNYRERMRSDVAFKLSRNLRSRFREVFKNDYKSGSVISDLGCTIQELKGYLEEQFQPGMTWNNYGLYGWHIDHIRPISSFDLTDRGQFLEACHYTNLQPLWARDNLRKGSKYTNN